MGRADNGWLDIAEISAIPDNASIFSGSKSSILLKILAVSLLFFRKNNRC